MRICQEVFKIARKSSVYSSMPMHVGTSSVDGTFASLYHANCLDHEIVHNYVIVPNHGTSDMTTPTSPMNTRRYLYVAVAALAALSIALLWLNDQQVQELQNAQNRLYNAQVEIRVLQAEKMFGAPFIAPFPVVDRHGQPAELPNFGEGRLLLLFFESWYSPTHLELMYSFGSVIGDNVPVVGILQAESAEEITPIVEKFRYSFPVYLAVDLPFDLPSSPYCVLIDRTGNVLHLSSIDYTDTTNSVEALISEISNIVFTAAAGYEGQPDPEAQPPSTGRPDQVADQEVGIYWPTAVDTKAEAIYYAPIPTDVVDLNFDGVTVIQLVVGTTGNVDTAFVERSSGRASVDSLMLDVTRKMVYTPAVHDGARVRMRVSYPYAYRKRPASPGAETVTTEIVTEETVPEE